MTSTRENKYELASGRVKNIAKITNAMQLIAASKMRRAQDRVTQGREYSQRMAETVAHLYGALGSDSIEQIPLLRRRLRNGHWLCCLHLTRTGGSFGK